MNIYKQLNSPTKESISYLVTFIRIILGLFFIFKGISFISNNRDFENLIAPMSNFLGGMFIFHYVAAAHIMCGIMLIFGLLTRWAVIAQLPILFGAVLINFIGDYVSSNLLLSFYSLICSLFFLFYGGGIYSADHYFKLDEK